MRTIMAGLAEFEHDLIRDRVKSGLAAARARGVKLGRQVSQRPSDKKAKRVLALHKEGLSYGLIGRNVGLSKNTVMDIVSSHLVPTTVSLSAVVTGRLASLSLQEENWSFPRNSDAVLVLVTPFRSVPAAEPNQGLAPVLARH
jgi:Resolvase, N terminal domain